MAFRWPLIVGFPGRGPALNPKLTRPGWKLPGAEFAGLNHPPPVTKSRGCSHEPPRVPTTPPVTAPVPPRGTRPPPLPSHVIELYALDTITSIPENHAWSAFTVIAFVETDEESICSLMMRVKTPGIWYTWFGAPVTSIGTPATLRSATSAAPYAPSQAALLIVYPKLAVTGYGVSARRPMSEVAVSLLARSVNPLVYERNTSAAANPLSPAAKGATRTPPSTGRLPVSAKYAPPKIGTCVYTP